MKKWSYAAAMLLAVTSGSVFTGCIDNDEPYGIEQIRLATANLLEAKKAALEAEAAATAAATELEKLKVELEKSKIENDKLTAEAAAKFQEAQAEAALKEAEAKAAQTQAEADKIQAEADKIKAEAEYKRAETQAYINAQNAELQRKLAALDADIKNWQLAYDKAVYAFEQTKAKVEETANSALWTQVEGAFGKYLEKLAAVNDANLWYVSALKELQEYEANLVWVEDENTPGHFDQPKYVKENALKSTLRTSQKNVNLYQSRVDKTTELLDKLNAIDASELNTTLEEYKEKLQTATTDYYKALAALDQAKADNAEVINKPDQIEEEITKFKEEEIEIPAYTFELTGALAQVNPTNVGLDVNKFEVVGSNKKYTLADPDPSGSTTLATEPLKDYTEAVDAYNTLIDALNQIKAFDDNDKVWIKAQLNELSRVLGPTAKSVTEGWEAAKAVYNMGNKPESKKAPNGEAVATAITDVETAQSAAIDAKKAYVAGKIKFQKDLKALGEKCGMTDPADPYGTYAPSSLDNYNSVKAAFGKLKSLYDNIRDKKEDALTDDEKKLKKAYDDADAANTTLEQSATALGEPAYLPKKKDGSDADPSGLYLAWTTAKVNLVGNGSDVKGAAPTLTAALTTQLSTISSEIGAFSWAANGNGDVLDFNYINTKDNKTWEDWIRDLVAIQANLEQQSYEVVTPLTAPLDYCTPNKAYVNANKYISQASVYTFGKLGTVYDKNDFIKDITVLVGADQKYNFADPIKSEKDILTFFNDYLAMGLPGATTSLKPWEYSTKYNKATFGAYGDEVLGKLYTYNLCKLADGGSLSTDVDAAVTEVKAQLTGITDTYNEKTAELETLEQEYTAAQTAADEATAEQQAAVDSALNDMDTYNQIVKDLTDGVNNIAALVNGSDLTINKVQLNDNTQVTISANPAEVLAQLIEQEEGNLVNDKILLEAAQDKLAQAQAALDTFNSDEYQAIPNPYSISVDYYKTILDNAKEEMEFWKNRYEALNQAYQKATGSNSAE